MANTRFFYDDCRTKKQLQQSTDAGRWILDTPGNGIDPYFIEDPYIRIQRWGGNLRTNAINIDSDLRGVNRSIGRDGLGLNYTDTQVKSASIAYPSTKALTTGQSRTTHPAWWFRDASQMHLEFPPIQPQLNTCLPFHNNINTRIIEKDQFMAKRDCVIQDTLDALPTLPFNNNSHSHSLCTSSNSCVQY